MRLSEAILGTALMYIYDKELAARSLRETERHFARPALDRRTVYCSFLIYSSGLIFSPQVSREVLRRFTTAFDESGMYRQPARPERCCWSRQAWSISHLDKSKHTITIGNANAQVRIFGPIAQKPLVPLWEWLDVDPFPPPRGEALGDGVDTRVVGTNVDEEAVGSRGKEPLQHHVFAMLRIRNSPMVERQLIHALLVVPSFTKRRKLD
jgi:hypothetical protein